MNYLKTHAVALGLICSAVTLSAQKITMTPGNRLAFTPVKESKPLNFVLNGNHYFFNEYYKNSTTNYYMQSFDNTGRSLSNAQLELNPGVFNNTYSIDQVVGVGTKVYALIEHLDKAGGKNTLLAREIDTYGKISDKEVEVMSIPFEKIMNSGYNNSAVSPDNKMLAVAGELPFVKEQPGKFKIALYNQDLKKVQEGEISLPGENTKNKSMSVSVANDGTVYLIKKGMTKKGEITLAVYQWSAASATEVKEYIVETATTDQPNNYITSYASEINAANELIISGTYYTRRTMSAGEKQAVGIFYFTNKGKSETLFKTFALDAPVDNLTARKVLVNGNTVFLTAEQFKENRITPPPSTAGSMNFDYNYDYTHKNEMIIAMDTEGNKKFQLELSKNFVVRDFDRQYFSGYFICNGKLTVIYNDQTSKYIKNDSYYQNIVPVLVQITNDGLMQPPVVFKNDLKLEQYYFLYPSVSVQDGPNQLSFLMGDNDNTKFLSMKIE